MKVVSTVSTENKKYLFKRSEDKASAPNLSQTLGLVSVLLDSYWTTWLPFYQPLLIQISSKMAGGWIRKWGQSHKRDAGPPKEDLCVRP